MAVYCFMRVCVCVRERERQQLVEYAFSVICISNGRLRLPRAVC